MTTRMVPKVRQAGPIAHPARFPIQGLSARSLVAQSRRDSPATRAALPPRVREPVRLWVILWAEFVESYHAVLRPGSEKILAKGNSPEVVTARDVRLGARLEGTKQPCHGAGKGVGKPGLGPPRAVPRPVIAAARVIERAGYASRPAGPADGALGKSVGALKSPADADVGTGPFTRQTGPDIVPARRPGTRGILKNVKVDAISVGERRASATSRARSCVREVIPTTGKPAWA